MCTTPLSFFFPSFFLFLPLAISHNPIRQVPLCPFSSFLSSVISSGNLFRFVLCLVFDVHPPQKKIVSPKQRSICDLISETGPRWILLGVCVSTEEIKSVCSYFMWLNECLIYVYVFAIYLNYVYRTKKKMLLKMLM